MTELMAKAVTCPVTSSDLTKNKLFRKTFCTNLQPDDIKEGHQELYSVQQAELCHGAQRFLQSHQLLDQVLGVGVLMAVGVPQVPPLHGHQHDGDLTVNDVDSLR